MGSPGTKAFLWTLFLAGRKNVSASNPSLSSRSTELILRGVRKCRRKQQCREAAWCWLLRGVLWRSDSRLWVLQDLRPPARRGWWLQAEHKPADPRLVGSRRPMAEIPETPPCYLTTTQSEEGHTRCSPPPAPTSACKRFFPGIHQGGQALAVWVIQGSLFLSWRPVDGHGDRGHLGPGIVVGTKWELPQWLGQ